MNMLCWLIIHTSNTSGRIATYAKSLRFKINLGETQTVSAAAHAGIQQRSHHCVNQEKNTGENEIHKNQIVLNLCMSETSHGNQTEETK